MQENTSEMPRLALICMPCILTYIGASEQNYFIYALRTGYQRKRTPLIES